MDQSEKGIASNDSKTVPDSDSNEHVELSHIELVQLDPQVVRRDIGPLRSIAVGFNINNSWLGIAVSLSIAISAGGTVSIIYGTIVSFVLYGCAATTLAELASVYPTAGGQYHFTSILSPKSVNRGLSYTCGIISTVAWVVLGSSVISLCAEMTMAFPQFYNGFEPKPWQYFLLFQGFNFLGLAYNLFLLKRTNWIHDLVLILSLSLLCTTSITCLALSEKRDSAWVWTNFEANTGWTPAVSFLTGLITPAYMYGGIDAAIHLAEETLNASVAVPRALVSTVVIGFVSTFFFSVAMCYCITDIAPLMDDPMPIYKLWRMATKSNTAGTIFLLGVIIIGIFIIIAIFQTTSRLIWAFARDRGTFCAPQLATLSPSLLEIPANALILTSGLLFLCGCLSLASTAAFEALLGSALLMQMVTFAFPAVLLIYRRRDPVLLPRKRAFRVPEVMGWICNFGTVLAAIVETVFFTFPGSLPVTGASMNYAVVVLAVIAVFTAINWFAYARKHYQGPRVELSL